MNRSEFEDMIVEALKGMPRELREKMSNVEIVIEDLPHGKELEDLSHRKDLSKRKKHLSRSLLGLYQGVPLTKRGIYYGWVLPDKITLYQKTIEAVYGQGEELKKGIREVVLHEIGHHFGLKEEDLKNIMNRGTELT